MDPGHGDVQRAVVIRQVPRRTQAHGGAGTPDVALEALLAGASDGLDPPGGQIDAPNGVAFGIGHIQHFAMESHTLRVVEGRLGERAVFQVLFARPDNMPHLSR